MEVMGPLDARARQQDSRSSDRSIRMRRQVCRTICAASIERSHNNAGSRHRNAGDDDAEPMPVF
jgi:hypothetical protein